MPAPLRFAVTVGVLSVAVVIAAAAAAQDPAPANPKASANVVRVDFSVARDAAPVRDLRQDELQLLEDDVPQTLDSFEHVEVAPGGPRARVFVVFVDTLHTAIEDSEATRLPIVRLLDRLLDRDDVVALMTPEMAAADMTFVKKSEVLSNLMQAEWTWARRGRRHEPGAKEVLYDQCFGSESGATRARAVEMKARWREQMTLDALDDLVAHLATVRDERKAVLTISEGWQLFTPNKTLSEPDSESSSRTERLRRFGDRGSRGGPPATPVMKVECEADRRRLALLDHSQRLRDVSEAANRANVSFYSFYAPEVSAANDGAARALAAEVARAGARQDSLRQIAEGTDGFVVLRRTDVDAALPKIVADETSYYLATYRSTNTKLDGRFRTLTAKVARPGVRVRLRRGYRGSTADDLLSTRRPGRGSRAVEALAAARVPDGRRPFRIRTASWHAPDGGTFWVVGELDYRTRSELAWTAGAKADIVVLGADGVELLSRTIDVKADEGGFAIQVPEQGAAKPGEYAVQVRLRPDANDTVMLSDTTRVVIGQGSANELGTPVVWRRGPSTGPRHLQTADARFQRSERIRLEMATTVPGTATARMIDRAGQPLIVPVQVSARDDESGRFRWIVADAALAPLAPGEYTIQVNLGTLRQEFVFTLVP